MPEAAKRPSKSTAEEADDFLSSLALKDPPSRHGQENAGPSTSVKTNGPVPTDKGNVSLKRLSLSQGAKSVATKQLEGRVVSNASARPGLKPATIPLVDLPLQHCMRSAMQQGGRMQWANRP